MPDEPNAKKLIRKALKRGPKELDALRTLVVGQLVEAGKSEKKATKVFEAKLALPLFSTAADGTVSLAGAAPAPAQASTAAKRKGDKAAPEPSAKKAKKATTVGAKAAASSSSGGAGAVRMMDAAAAAAYCEQNNVTLTGRGADAFRPLAGFADSGFGADALAAVAKFERPTPIQAVCWPVIAAGRDVVGVAETGSGKTLAFFLPAVSLLQAAAGKAGGGGAPCVRMLCLEPTRELAMQTEEVCAAAGKACGIASVCIYGGVPKGPQTGALKRGAQVVIATPGRLLDLYQNDGAVELARLEYLVLDEADRMLDMGFEKDVRTIIGATPASRRTVMFTATWPEAVRALASEFLRDNVRVNIGSDVLSANHRVSQCVEVMEQQQKEKRLLELLKTHVPSSGSNKVLVFALYKKEAARVESMLRSAGHQCVCIQGDMSQAARTASLEQFKSGKVPLLVATDVAARGLDIPLVEVVINYTFPLTIEDYVHRIGRTGRGGRTGHAHTFFTSFDKAHAGALQNILREASQPVPDALTKFGSTVKKKEHKLYGAFGPKEGHPMKAATKIVFGDDD